MGDGIEKAFLVLNILAILGILALIGGFIWALYQIANWIF